MKKLYQTLTIILVIAVFAVISFAQNITINRDSMNSKTEVSNQRIKIGEKVDKVRFEKVFNSPQNSFALKDLKNKIVILEFWATWCGPCFPAIENLKKLKEKFPNQLEVISVLQESEERLQRYMKNKPSSLWHVADPERKLNEYFPHRAIPHTVVIDSEGKIAAITNPEAVTEAVISQLINKRAINLPKKEDGLGGNFDMTKDYFPKPENTEFAFDVQPPIAGGLPMMQRQRRGVWANRRLTLINQSIFNIYRVIFRFSSVRTIFEGIDKSKFDSHQSKTAFCLDVIVPKGKEDELYSYAQKELEALDFEIKAKIEKRKTEVGVLTLFDKEKLMAHKSEKTNPTGDPKLSSQPTDFSLVNASQYKRNAASIDDLVKNYLESFGLLKIPIVNETGIDGLFNFEISLDLEDKSTLKNALAKYGLKISKEERETEMLVIYK